ncbi:MAG: hypothetical protein KY439_11240, partial [Actinobacteria bacterium]|nr:hypothetical protein [Actinomycetota bacterium]
MLLVMSQSAPPSDKKSFHRVDHEEGSLLGHELRSPLAFNRYVPPQRLSSLIGPTVYLPHKVAIKVPPTRRCLGHLPNGVQPTHFGKILPSAAAPHQTANRYFRALPQWSTFEEVFQVLERVLRFPLVASLDIDT